jgi:hypothetical protein
MKDPLELKRFIKKKLQSGYPEGELKNELLSQGYTPEQIEKAIYDPGPLHDKLKKQSPIKINNSLWYGIAFGLIIIGIALASLRFWGFAAYGYGLIILGGLMFFTKIFLTLIKDEDN